MSKTTILFVSHLKTRCGVYEFGRAISTALAESVNYNFVRVECDSLNDLKKSIVTHQPKVIIYNYHPSVMPWLCTKISKGIYKNNVASINVKQIGIVHEITQTVADKASAYRNSLVLGKPDKKLNSLFDFYIAPDPTLLLKNPLVFKTGRLIPEYKSTTIDSSIPIIGSFGFATPNKGFTKIVQKVQDEFDEAVIRLNMPFAEFGDKDGANAKRIADECKALIKNPKIKLEISHDFLNDNQLLDFLSNNSLNVFLYEDTKGRGLSSAIDFALASKKPIAISRCSMFRHILQANPSVCIEDLSLKTILNNGFAPLQTISKDWNKAIIIWEYERILNAVIANNFSKPKMGIKRTILSKFNRIFTEPDKTFSWLRNSEKATDDDLTVNKSIGYVPVIIPKETGFNRILDDSARTLYKPAIDKLIELVPKTMSQKIADANVQQAFVFDTVFRNIPNYKNPKMLCVGSYEDTASLSLMKMGFEVEEIDPMINYFLQEYYTKPTTIKGSYDIIFSTSVIEHDPNDKTFIECIDGLLAPNGIAVITCDYKDGWQQGQPKPDADARFYTKNDLENRLLSYMTNCELVDESNWDCLKADFLYSGIYYSFATFVVRKKD